MNDLNSALMKDTVRRPARRASDGAASGLWIHVCNLCLMALAAVCAVLSIVTPESELSLIDDGEVIAAHLYADNIEPTGTSKVSWINRHNFAFECNISYGVAHPFCGVVIKFKRPSMYGDPYPDTFDFPDATAIDLSSYERLRIDFDYKGPSKTVNVFLRNGDLPKSWAEYELVNYYKESIPTDVDTAVAKLADFRPVAWWVERFSPLKSELNRPFNSVIEVGIDLPGRPEEGVHSFTLRSITAVRPLVPPLLISAVGLGALALLIVSLLSRVVWRKYVQPYHEENRNLRDAANEDRLTGCLNRTGLDAAIEAMLHLNGSADLHVVVMDLDHFKRFNDNYGHAIGDQVLQQAAMALSKQLRNDDVLGRWGGEEFVLLTKITTEDGVHVLIARLMQALKTVQIRVGEETLSVTMSIGATKIEAGEPFTKAFHRADSAMYQAKESGRNTYRIF